ncbi:hypothetical protein [Persicitalea jodogahamensis]|uniref:Lipoprotein n=1 Tax=Persicitalea jodogahamensis TaxID=402147 RepID=A0A8J3DAY7_9BACT|nr:hypothetical protein [Persicitalea jodogahamensis]GHB70560.1 hypothetical protein GCM10007390_25340 [Persicitalea jodogahamensis]
MKYLASLLITVGMLVSCKSDEIGPEPDDYTVKYQKSISIEKYSMTFIGLEDSRCPANVFCFTGGSVQIDLKFTSTKSDLPGKQLRLCQGDCLKLRDNGSKTPETGSVVLDGTTYLMTVLEVNPYPATSEAAKQKEKYEVKLMIQTLP